MLPPRSRYQSCPPCVAEPRPSGPARLGTDEGPFQGSAENAVAAPQGPLHRAGQSPAPPLRKLLLVFHFLCDSLTSRASQSSASLRTLAGLCPPQRCSWRLFADFECGLVHASMRVHTWSTFKTTRIYRERRFLGWENSELSSAVAVSADDGHW